MLQNVKITAFTVSELLRVNQQGGGLKIPPTQTRVKLDDLNNFRVCLNTAPKMKFCIIEFFSKCHQIRSFRQIWLRLLETLFLVQLNFYIQNQRDGKKAKWNSIKFFGYQETIEMFDTFFLPIPPNIHFH